MPARDEPAAELVGARAPGPGPGDEELVQVEDAHQWRAKASRALDLVVASTGLLISSPLLAAAAVAIKLDSPGPVIFRHRRVGLGGRPFDLLKLRTMVSGAETMGAGLYVLAGDTRITRTGRVLRRLSLDELPNLVNVLRGEMAVVGPRPTVQEQVDRYTERQLRRLAVKPGITGWAQVNGRTSLSWPQRIELDIWYAQHRSLRLDIRILGKTVLLLATGRGLYSEDQTQGWGPPGGGDGPPPGA